MGSAGRIMSRFWRPSHVQTGAIARRIVHARRSLTTVTLTPGMALPVGCANGAEVLEGVLGALDSHDFVFGRLMGLGVRDLSSP
jgi:hypothetical protein